ncbi:MAG: gamma carbonic anhydrase family protein [Alphaproteobacteria bacterium]|jgi:carbonic anhydrase/acetyltransferase-like protein (isoleucine patch superfamily)|nr:gamma carbonic anhydrase family protein [Alphaproteobacteria bacterium]
MGNIMTYRGIAPVVDETTFVAPGAHVIGEVTLGAHTTIWYNCVVRGDQEPIHIGARTNLQDGSIVHTSKGISGTWIGENVLIGHGCVIHACRLEDRAFIGMGSVVLDLSVVEAGAMLAAGSVLTPGKRIPSGQLWAGSPARYMRDLRPEESVVHDAQVEEYVQLGVSHTASLR